MTAELTYRQAYKLDKLLYDSGVQDCAHGDNPKLIKYGYEDFCLICKCKLGDQKKEV